MYFCFCEAAICDNNDSEKPLYNWTIALWLCRPYQAAAQTTSQVAPHGSCSSWIKRVLQYIIRAVKKINRRLSYLNSKHYRLKIKMSYTKHVFPSHVKNLCILNKSLTSSLNNKTQPPLSSLYAKTDRSGEDLFQPMSVLIPAPSVSRRWSKWTAILDYFYNSRAYL